MAAPLPEAPAALPVLATPAEPTPVVPLEKLLQLPAATASDPEKPEMDDALVRKTGPQPADEKASASKLPIDVDTRTDAPIERPGSRREQADAAAEADISSDTTL